MCGKLKCKTVERDKVNRMAIETYTHNKKWDLQRTNGDGLIKVYNGKI